MTSSSDATQTMVFISPLCAQASRGWLHSCTSSTMAFRAFTINVVRHLRAALISSVWRYTGFATLTGKCCSKSPSRSLSCWQFGDNPSTRVLKLQKSRSCGGKSFTALQKKIHDPRPAVSIIAFQALRKTCTAKQDSYCSCSRQEPLVCSSALPESKKNAKHMIFDWRHSTFGLERREMPRWTGIRLGRIGRHDKPDIRTGGDERNGAVVCFNGNLKHVLYALLGLVKALKDSS